MAGDVDPTKREKLFRALLEGQNHSQAAETCGYSRKHVKELVKQPAFARELERRRAALPPVQDDPDEEMALEAAREIVKDDEQPGTARVQAAKLLLERVDKRRAPKAAPPTTQEPTEVTPEKKRTETPAEAAARFGIKLA
jgi:hypothetical protein